MQEMWAWSLGWEDPLEKGMVTHLSILAWRNPWAEEPGGLQSIVLQRVRHKLSNLACMHNWHICFPGGSDGKEPTCNSGDPGSIPGLGRSLDKETSTRPSIPAWRIPWIWVPGGLQFMGSQRVAHDWTSKHTHTLHFWAIVSSRSCFWWLYRASPSSAAKNIINLISVLTIWWCHV